MSKYSEHTEQTSAALDTATELGLAAITCGMSVAFTPSNEFRTTISEGGREVASGTGATSQSSRDAALDNLRGKG